MRILQTIAIIALACVAAAQDKANLARQFNVGDAKTYKLTAKIDQGGTIMEMKGVVRIKTAKPEKEGKADLEFTCSDFSQSANGSVIDANTPNPLKTKVDKHGMPESLETTQNGAMYIVISVASYLPAKELAKGEEFKIDWHAKDEGGSVSGKGTVVDIKTVDGVKVAVLKYKVTVNPAGHDNPADLEIVSEINLADGTLMKSTMKGNIAEGSIDVTIASVGK